MTYAVEGFFNNGGQRCYIGRIVKLSSDMKTAKAKQALLTIDPITVKAIGEGAWGSRIAMHIEDSSNDETKFKLTIAYWKSKFPAPEEFQKPQDAEDQKKQFKKLIESATQIEVFDDLSEDPDKPDYYMKRLNESDTLSFYVYLESTTGGRAPRTENFFDPLKDGSDDSDPLEPLDRGDFLGDPEAQPGKRRGLTAFNDIDDISILYVPDANMITNEDARNTLYGDILTQCELLKDRFAIIDVKEDESNISDLNIGSVARNSKYGAIYYPWIKLLDP